MPGRHDKPTPAARHAMTARRLLRLLLGLAGAALGLFGAYWMSGPHSPLPVPAWRVPGALLFLGATAFALGNVALARPWRWPGYLMLAAIVLLFLTRAMVPA